MDEATSFEGAGLRYLKNAGNVAGKNGFNAFIMTLIPFAITLSKIACEQFLGRSYSNVWCLQPCVPVWNIVGHNVSCLREM